MNATQLPARRKTANKTDKTPTRPVAQMLLELAYHLHATKVVGVREVPQPRQNPGRAI
jgi:hypothetical protein